MRGSYSGWKAGLCLLVFVFAVVSPVCPLPDAAAGGPGQEKDPPLTSLVDPFIGTGGHGHTYPGASLPFGMVQLSPDSRLTGWDGCSAYHHSDSLIYGFSHTHLSGTGCSDYGDILFMPGRGEVVPFSGAAGGRGYRGLFSHASEEAKPGYYSVMLDGLNVSAELTVTKRCGFHRYIFGEDPEGGDPNMIIDLAHRDEVIESAARIASPDEICGFRRSRAWADDQHVYFVARFSMPFSSYGIAVDGELQEGMAGAKGKDIKPYVRFSLTGADTVLVKVGISAVSIEGARRNLDAEIGRWDFDRVAGEALESWESALSKIRVKGGTEEQMKVFYTALYHSMLAPNLYMDVDGSYRGRDLEVHVAEGFDYYTVFSLWDTYRAAHPLFTIIEPERTVDFIETFLRQYEQGGLLPVWELSANETGCMIGYHSIPVITDAYIKGIRDFDAEKALEAMKESAGKDHLGLEYYKKLGYIPADRTGQSVSRTLEYAYDDWCIAQMANALGDRMGYEEFTRRALYYANLYDPSTGFMRPRVNGGWAEPFDPDEATHNYTEANAWQYSFYVPQDIEGLARLHGGTGLLASKLDDLFSRSSEKKGLEMPDITGLIGQYAHGNEPSQHMAYLYDYLGRPWKTQKMVREIMDTMYHTGADGLCGNEDCGQMSAWYVLSALGFYPVTPGLDIYAIGTPLFPEAEIDLGHGMKFRIVAENVSQESFYIQNASLNGREWTKAWIAHGEIMMGGEIVFAMGPRPSFSWGRGKDDAPRSSIGSPSVCPVPYISPPVLAFSGSIEVSLGCAVEGADIYYTDDGSEPGPGSTLYEGPFTLDRSAVIKAFAAAEGMERSLILTSEFRKVRGGMKVTLGSQYNSMYTGGGDLALVDGIRGSTDFHSGGWQGYRGIDFEAVIDLGEVRSIESISAGFLHSQGAWIFMPRDVEYALSRDGSVYEVVAEIENDVPDQTEEPLIREFAAGSLSSSARYVRVRAKSIGECPAWHGGAGGKAWIFIDEITIEP